MLLSVDKMWQDNDWVIDTMGGEKNSVFLELFRREGRGGGAQAIRA